MSRDDDDSLLSRWSRRKRAVAAQTPSVPAGPLSEPDGPPAEEEPQGTDEARAALSEPELLHELGLPDPDTLKQGDDFSAFMKANVPDVLRRRALRRLWTSNPVLANVDGLVDYGGDFTDAALVPEVLNTAYKVGKGILRDIASEDTPEPENPGQDADDADDHGAEDDDLPLADAAAPAPSRPEPAVDLADAEEPAPPRPRRMQFKTN
jgi:hypothetical protein